MQDAACLERARLDEDKLFRYQQKTGTPVYCPLPPTVVETLAAVTNANERYFFYDGSSQPESMVKSWDRGFKKVGHVHDRAPLLEKNTCERVAGAMRRGRFIRRARRM